MFALGQARVQGMLSSAEGAVDGAVQVPPSAGLWIASQVHTYQPAMVAAANDLASISGQASSFRLKDLAHHWHTGVYDPPVFSVPPSQVRLMAIQSDSPAADVRSPTIQPGHWLPGSWPRFRVDPNPAASRLCFTMANPLRNA